MSHPPGTPSTAWPREVVDQLHEILLELKKPKARDGWDKFGLVGTFLSTVVVALLAIGVKVSTDRTNSQIQKQNLAIQAENNSLNNAIQRQNTNIEQAAVIEKFLPHLATGDPSKHSAEMMIVWLGYPEVVRQFAVSDGDLEILEDVSHSPLTPSFDQSMKDAYDRSIQQLRTEWNRDKSCLAGNWYDQSSDTAPVYHWKFELLEPRHLTMTRLNETGASGQSDLRKIGDRWQGQLKLAEYSWDLELVPKSCNRIQANRGFTYIREH